MEKIYEVVIEPGEDGWVVVTVPALPGCITQGKTIEEAEKNAKEAIEVYLESLVKLRKVIPDQKGVAIRKVAVKYESIMTRLPLLPARKVIMALTRLGFIVDHQKGSHIVLKNPDETRTIVMQDHPELDRGTLKSILKQAGIDVDALLSVRTLLK